MNLLISLLSYLKNSIDAELNDTHFLALSQRDCVGGFGCFFRINELLGCLEEVLCIFYPLEFAEYILVSMDLSTDLKPSEMRAEQTVTKTDSKC